jgi:dTDP-glucose 4,6-dehydratase
VNILVTGGAGFIGSNYIRYVLNHDKCDKIVNLDKLTYAGNVENLSDMQGNPNYTFIRGDIGNPELVDYILRTYLIDTIVHFAAESHVDRSIVSAEPFVRTNVAGTLVLLEAARKRGVYKFVHVSTDEVYGTLGPTGAFNEQSMIQPNSPYAASKAGSDLLVRAYHETYGLNVNITRCSNNYGPYQFPEKLIPLMITSAMEDKPLPLYGDGMNVRDWIHVEDHARAINLVVEKGQPGEVYNIGGRSERTNREVVEEILRLLDKPVSLIRFAQDRLGHDRRYAIDPSKIERELGFHPAVSFEEGLMMTVRWYCKNPYWWRRIQSGLYMEQPHMESYIEPREISVKQSFVG